MIKVIMSGEFAAETAGYDDGTADHLMEGLALF